MAGPDDTALVVIGSWGAKQDIQAGCTSCNWKETRRTTMRSMARRHAATHPGHSVVVVYQGTITYQQGVR